MQVGVRVIGMTGPIPKTTRTRKTKAFCLLIEPTDLLNGGFLSNLVLICLSLLLLQQFDDGIAVIDSAKDFTGR